MTPEHFAARLITAARSLSGPLGALFADPFARLSRGSLNAAMAQAFGTSDTTGRWSQRDSFEALEVAQVLALRGREGRSPGIATPGEQLAAYQALIARLPTATARSEAQIAAQQFSTPLPIAFCMALIGAPTAQDLVLEPSAGTGLIALFAARAGAPLVLNELHPRRHALLAQLFPNTRLMQVDASYIHEFLDDDSRPSLVLMNPPFSRTAGGAQDRLAGDRHVIAAAKALLPDGRLVALVPAWVSDRGAHARLFDRLAALGSLRANVLLPSGALTKHGTSVGVRVLVFDRAKGLGPAICAQPGSLADMLPLVAALPRLQHNARPAMPACPEALVQPTRRSGVVASTTRQPKPSASGLAFLAGLQFPAPPMQPSAAPSQAEGLPKLLDYTVRPEPLPAPPGGGLYCPYQVASLDIVAAASHPTPLVESLAMASVTPPPARYRPLLPAHLVQDGLLSAPQLETVIMAGEAHARFLPGRHVPTETGLALAPSPSGQAYRTGYFLGDGTGCGKGRQVAAILLDNWLKGRKRGVWVSASALLIEDARRDWQALGGLALDVQPQDGWTLNEALGLASGVLFTTYATLRSANARGSRLQQLLNWLGPDFDGVIVFDEAHSLANAAPNPKDGRAQKGSAQGLAGLVIQNRLPAARILYVSATGATRLENLSYATRLGLWGDETAFANREAFMSGLAEGGIAALELVARDLKAQGLYAARALSYAGIEYDILEHPLSAAQISDYDAYCEAWAIIHQNLAQVLEATQVVDRFTGKSLNPQALGAALSAFEATKQRFFAQLLTGAKMPSVIAAIEQDLRDGRACVVQLVSTAQAMLDRRLAQLPHEARADLSIDLSPKEYVIDYLRNAFPTVMMETLTDEDGKTVSQPLRDTHGHLVHSKEALAYRDALIEDLCALPAVPTALDQLIDHFGPDRVAEVTGRTRRLITRRQGRQVLERRSGLANSAETQAFMNDDKRILVFSDAGGTGRGYHADLAARNKRRRVHYLLEPGWRADRAVQGLGRSHRTHQASAPIFRPVTTNCKGERRFISTIARRLDSLGALTRGQRQTGGQNLFDPADNLESDLAREALTHWYRLLIEGKIACISVAEFERRTALKLTSERSSAPVEPPPIHRFLNRLLALPIALQNDIFESLFGLITARTEAALANGSLDRGVETLNADAVTLNAEHCLRTDPITGAVTHLLDLTIRNAGRALTQAEALATLGPDQPVTLMINSRSGHAAFVADAWSLLGEDGTLITRKLLLRPTGRETVRRSAFDASHWKACAQAAFTAAWDAQSANIASQIDETRLYLVSGLILPIWRLLKDSSPTVYRLMLPGGRPILGRVVLASHVPALTAHLGVAKAVQLRGADLATALLQHRETMRFHGHETLLLKSSVVNGHRRIEVLGATAPRLPWFKAQGCFTEVIQYKTRLFIPTDRAPDILETLLAHYRPEYEPLEAA